MPILYRNDASLTVAETIDLYRRSTLGERRPVDRPDLFSKMLTHADIVVTAWDNERLVGIARTLTDFSYVAYLADLAVDQAYQKQGIGRTLIQNTRERLDPECMIVLFAAPGADSYYDTLGFERNARGWMLKAGQPFGDNPKNPSPSRQ